MIRLNKFLAEAGIGSRRKCEQYILEGKVLVDNEIITSVGAKISLDSKVFFENKQVIKNVKEYFLLNKPVGYVTTRKDPQNRKTVMDLMRNNKEVYPVGRLDRLSRGLLIMTNDGELAFRLMHPSYMIWKEYIVTISRKLSKKKLDLMRSGIEIEGKLTAPAKVEIIKYSKEKCILKINLREGRKREIRRMCRAVGTGVIDLFRVKIGSLSIGDLEEGKFRRFNENEILKLKNIVGL